VWERSSKTLTLMATSDNDFSSLPLGWRGLAYIVPSSEFGPSDQTDIDRTVFLDPLGRWSIIREVGPDWPRRQGGHPRGEGGRPTLEPVRSPVRSRGFWTLLD